MVTVNVALSLNGMMAGRNGRRVTISGREDLARVHLLRSESDAIMVGAGTIINDNPFLGVDRDASKESRRPVRVILDEHLRIPPSSNALNGQQDTIIFSSASVEMLGNARVIRKDRRDLSIESIIGDLEGMGMRKILVEGGRDVINQLIRSRIIDHFFVYIGNILIEGDGMPLFSPGMETRIRFLEVRRLGEGVVINLDPQSLYP